MFFLGHGSQIWLLLPHWVFQNWLDGWLVDNFLLKVSQLGLVEWWLFPLLNLLSHFRDLRFRRLFFLIPFWLRSTNSRNISFFVKFFKISILATWWNSNIPISKFRLFTFFLLYKIIKIVFQWVDFKIIWVEGNIFLVKGFDTPLHRLAQYLLKKVLLLSVLKWHYLFKI